MDRDKPSNVTPCPNLRLQNDGNNLMENGGWQPTKTRSTDSAERVKVCQLIVQGMTEHAGAGRLENTGPASC